MYRISLYRGYFERRQQAKARVMRTGLLAVLVGLEVVLVGSLGLSSVLLGEQAANVRDEVGRLSGVPVQATDETALATARQLVEIRRGRIDWSPKLAALSRTITPSLRLVQCVGQGASGDRAPHLEVTGEAGSAADEMAVVSGFIEMLRKDPGIASAFPAIKLGALDGSGSNRFSVVCEPEARSGS